MENIMGIPGATIAFFIFCFVCLIFILVFRYIAKNYCEDEEKKDKNIVHKMYSYIVPSAIPTMILRSKN